MGDRKESNYVVACINEFGRQKNLSAKESYLYLIKFKGIEFLKEFYDVKHLLSFENVAEDLARVCRNNEARSYDSLIIFEKDAVVNFDKIIADTKHRIKIFPLYQLDKAFLYKHFCKTHAGI